MGNAEKYMLLINYVSTTYTSKTGIMNYLKKC